jgi:hypothetical protein
MHVFCLLLGSTSIMIGCSQRDGGVLFGALPKRHPLMGLGQGLAAVELVTEDDTVGCDLILARKRIMGAAASFEHAQCAFELGVATEELEQDHVVGQIRDAVSRSSK